MPAGSGESSDLSGLLVQAIAVRRHGSSMMVVMTVMVAVLHLLSNYVQTPLVVNTKLTWPLREAHWGAVSRLQPKDQTDEAIR